jgi:hypothetical protein
VDCLSIDLALLSKFDPNGKMTNTTTAMVGGGIARVLRFSFPEYNNEQKNAAVISAAGIGVVPGRLNRHNIYLENVVIPPNLLLQGSCWSMLHRRHTQQWVVVFQLAQRETLHGRGHRHSFCPHGRERDDDDDDDCLNPSFSFDGGVMMMRFGVVRMQNPPLWRI